MISERKHQILQHIYDISSYYSRINYQLLSNLRRNTSA